MCRNVFYDWYVFKETKILMFSSRGNHAYVAKTDMFYAKQLIFKKFQNHFAVSLVNILKPQKLSARPNCFWKLSSRVSPLFAALTLVTITLTTQQYSILNIHGDDTDLRIQEYHTWSRHEYHSLSYLSQFWGFSWDLWWFPKQEWVRGWEYRWNRQWGGWLND